MNTQTAKLNKIGYGDYTKDRAKILGNPSVEELYNNIKKTRKPKS